MSLMAQERGRMSTDRSPTARAERLLWTREAARFIGVSAHTLQNCDRNGMLPADRTPGGMRRYRAIERLVAEDAIIVSGGGKPGNPFRFSLPPPPCAICGERDCPEPDGKWCRYSAAQR